MVPSVLPHGKPVCFIYANAMAPSKHRCNHWHNHIIILISVDVVIVHVNHKLNC